MSVRGRGRKVGDAVNTRLDRIGNGSFLQNGLTFDFSEKNEFPKRACRI